MNSHTQTISKVLCFNHRQLYYQYHRHDHHIHIGGIRLGKKVLQIQTSKINTMIFLLTEEYHKTANTANTHQHPILCAIVNNSYGKNFYNSK
ncbi:hypothetical protein pb186bvf_005042 [Paramecium bursaria]